ncbi:DUF3757 domain-containing protein [Pseudomonas brassicacearum]|uniref:DUF3757 domain-containing protein n=1 Tax=Pseudomonas TaxID=286 RepID=UPI0004265746|nr:MULTISPECIES: DUF3757 domain-containing protein [Pseudomonas]KIR16525.1 hypothetical protein PFLU4_26910 [Pseudomonas fluorescens]ALQ06170.1 hypothetical protein AK973_5721 [Pseudomonas brassicacearum]PJH90536.1 DUF3757 domain-containing protein [Pseudomonas sp. WCS365]ROM78869.1 DUF3757 domain-containing protein [Pseudomonas brassicacearum]UII14803.1 hypothetical protein LRP86_01693 [Pseudomonas brassicacearum]
MKRILAGGAVLLWLIIGHAHAGEITCPAVTDIRRNIETVEDVFFVDIQDGHEWESESLVDVVDPSSLRFEGAKYVIHETDEDTQAVTRATITCRYGDINLNLEYQQILEPAFSVWVDNRCESPDTRMCRLMDGDYFNLIY